MTAATYARAVAALDSVAWRGIMPGLERAEPDRTLTSSGSLAAPNHLPVSFSSRARLLDNSARSSLAVCETRPHAARR